LQEASEEAGGFTTPPRGKEDTAMLQESTRADLVMEELDLGYYIVEQALSLFATSE
jgi:hypothetical protein